MYVPHHNAGGETTIHAAFRAMVQRGHEVHVICRPHTQEIQFEPYTFEGVQVVRPTENSGHQWFRGYTERFDPDLLLTHLDLTFDAECLSLDTSKPLAHFVHNDIRPGFHRVTPNKCQLAIYNSKWVAESFAYKDVPSIVLHPVVEPEKYQCERGNKITFINPTVDKGADTFYALSKVLPEQEFLCVKSVYGEQIAPPNINPALHPNVETMEHTADVRGAFRKTRVILMPSIYESYGRVAVEAACAGIPSIVHPTEGLLEALGADCPAWVTDFARESLKAQRERRAIPTPTELRGGWVSGAGIFCDRNDINSWRMQAERLINDEGYYRERSDAALNLAASLQPQQEFDRLEKALLSTIETSQSRGIQAMRMWTSDSWIWKLQDGNYKKTDDRRIPVDAVTLFAGIGTNVPYELAQQHGWIGPDAKAIEAPAENKAFTGPDQIKTINIGRQNKKKAAA